MSEALRHPLSIGQQGLWYIAQSGSQANASYNLVLAFAASAPLDTELLRRGLQAMLRRHPVLSARVVQDGPFPEFECDAAAMPLLEQATGPVADVAAAESARAFDLEQGPPCRFVVVHGGPEGTDGFVATFHHIAFDGTSASVFLSELEAACALLAQGQAIAFDREATAPWQLAEQESHHLASDPGHAAVASAARRLAGVPAAIELPGRTAEARNWFRAGTCFFELAPAAAHAAASLASQCQVTTAAVYLGAFQVLLWHYTRARDFAVGIPVSYHADGAGPGIGYMTNVGIVRARLDASQRIGSWLEAVADDLFQLVDERRLPYPLLAKALRSGGDGDGVSFGELTQVAFNHQRLQRERWHIGGAELRPAAFQMRWAKNQIKLDIEEGAERTCGSLAYDADSIEAWVVEAMARQLEALLLAMARDPQARIGALPSLPDALRQRVLVQWNDTAAPYPADSSIPAQFEAQVSRSPDAVALRAGATAVTYAELNARANQIGRLLQSNGAAPGTVVGIGLERGIDMVAGLLGILKCGAAYLPVDGGLPPQRIEYMLRDSGASLLLAQASAAAWPSSAARLVDPVDAESLSMSQQDLGIRLGGRDLAYCLYTSGSTGSPKGVAVEHRSVLRLVKGTRYAWLEAGEVFLQAAPLAFDASTFEIWGSLLNGAELVLMPPGAPTLEDLADAIQAHAVSTLWMTAALFEQFTARHLPALANVRHLLAGGDVLSPQAVAAVVDGLPSCTLVNGYGPTETTTFATCHTVAPGDGPGPVPIGRPIANTAVYVLDERLAPVPPGAAGELYIAGDGVARGYVNRPDLTAERFLPDPFGPPGSRMYATGDRARHREDGVIEFLGRRDRQVKIRGFRIELDEVEAALAACEGVGEAAVVAVDGAAHKRIAAHVVPREPGLTVEVLRSRLQRRLPDYMIPAAWSLRDALPLTPSGKVDRRALAQAALSPEPAVSVVPESATPTQALVRDIWAAVLGRDTVGLNEDFFVLGGHSLMATQIASRIGDALGLRLPLRALLEHRTVATLARHIDQVLRSGAGAQAPVPVIVPRARRTAGAVPG